MHIIVVKLGSDAVAFFELTTLLCMNDTVKHPNRVSLNLFFGMDDSGKAWFSGFRVNEPIFRGGSIHKDVETRNTYVNKSTISMVLLVSETKI